MKGAGRFRMGLVYSWYFKRTVAGYTDKPKGETVPGALPKRLNGLRFHDLRHTCAALSIAAGAHPKLIQARLGRSSITITLDRSGHLFPSVEEAPADALNSACHPRSSQAPEVACLANFEQTSDREIRPLPAVGS